MPKKTPKMEHIQGVASDAFISHSPLILETYLMWHNPAAVFKNILVYWHK